MFVATQAMLGWYGEQIGVGVTAPTKNWPADYVADLVASGVLTEVADPVAPAPDLPEVLLDAGGKAVRPANGR